MSAISNTLEVRVPGIQRTTLSAGEADFYRSHGQAPPGLEQVVKSACLLPSVMTDGRTIDELVIGLRSGGLTMSDYAENNIRHLEFTGKERFRELADDNVTVVRPSRISVGIETHFDVVSVAGLPESDRLEEKIRRSAYEKGMIDPSAESAALLRLAISDETIAKMGFRALVVMHEPIPEIAGSTGLLTLHAIDDVPAMRNRVVCHHLHSSYKPKGKPFPEEFGYVFERRVSAQT